MPTEEGRSKVHTIQNEFLKVGVLSKGAELCSIINVENNTEYLWQANPEIWASHAPNLFPVIGALKEGSYYYEGEEYSMPKHGFIRYNKQIQLKEKTGNSLLFNLNYSEETLKTYPFKFQYALRYKLEEKTLRLTYTVKNLDDKSMYFSLGGHPAFNTPLFDHEVYEDYYLEFDYKMDMVTHLLNDKGLISHKTKKIAENSQKLRLHKNLFDNDALIFTKVPSKYVSLKSKKSGEILSVRYGDFQNLGIWAKPGAPFVCIEPWLGIADLEETKGDIKTKEGIIKLMPSTIFNASFTIQIA